MGSRKTQAQRTFPLLHTLPQKSRLVLTSSLQITTRGGGGSSASGLQGEFVIPSSPKNDRSLLFSFFHSSAAMTPFRTCLEQDMVEFFLFFVWYFLLFTPHMVYIVYPASGEYDQ